MQQQFSLIDRLIERSREAFIRGVIWAFIGILYGILFVSLSELATAWELPINPYFFSGIMAGTIGALIYSSMRLAVLMAIIVSPICILYFVFLPVPINLGNLLLIVGLAGGIIGALYGAFSNASRINRADAKTLAGFSAGFLVSLGYLILSVPLADVSLGMVVGFMCPLTGALYVLFVPSFIRFYDNTLPPVGDGGLVGTGVAGFLAISFFVMISSINSDTAGPLLPWVQRIHELLPQAVAGGLVGGGIAGILSGLLIDEWQDL